MADRRIGNCWLSTPQVFLDEYRAMNQALTAEPPEIYTGPMDMRTYEIVRDTVQDPSGAVERQYNSVTEGPEQPYKMFSMWQEGEQQVKQDIDYLLALTWTTLRALGSWWNDTGIQGGMQPAVIVDPDNPPDPPDPPTGTPFYPIPNNAYLFMPDVVVYDEDGNEVSRTPATSNADLRDINLLQGQVPRDFTQYP